MFSEVTCDKYIIIFVFVIVIVIVIVVVIVIVIVTVTVIVIISSSIVYLTAYTYVHELNKIKSILILSIKLILKTIIQVANQAMNGKKNYRLRIYCNNMKRELS